ncbi:MAG: hypothetical protein JF614_03625 [Acidobacteria bacterium]|nr:hypothetical protein [Acidobacteriota bacterium]
MLLDPPPRFSPAHNPVNRLRATLPVITAEDGSPVLPGFILWAFSLNEGDLLAVSPGPDPVGSCRFLSYAERVWSAKEECSHPWPHVEELLRQRMAAVGPRGALRLPEEAQALLAGGQVLLRAESHAWRGSFTLEPVGGRRLDPELFLEAGYLLPVLPGFQVMLPADLLWVLDIDKGDQLACKQSLATADFEPCELKKPPEGWQVVELGRGGLLALPESLRVPSALKPNAQVRLEVTLSPRAALRVRQWVGLE